MSRLETVTKEEVFKLFIDEYFDISKIYYGKEQKIKELKGLYDRSEERIKIFPRNCENLDDELIILLHEFVHYRDDHFNLSRTEEETDRIAIYMFRYCRDVLDYILETWQYRPYKRQTLRNSYS